MCWSTPVPGVTTMRKRREGKKGTNWETISRAPFHNHYWAVGDQQWGGGARDHGKVREWQRKRERETVCERASLLFGSRWVMVRLSPTPMLSRIL